MQDYDSIVVQRRGTALNTNSVLRNTFMLLSLTLLFSAATAGLAVMTNAAPMNPWLLMIGYFGLLFATQATSQTGLGLVFVFALTGFMGFTLGPVLNLYLNAFSNGGQLIMTAFAGTGAIFVTLSMYAMSSQKDFSYMGGFLSAAAITAFIAGLAAMVFNMPMLDLIVSSAFMLISSGFILFEVSQIVNGGERNYILATVSLYVSIFNIFVNLLRLLAVFVGNRD